MAGLKTLAEARFIGRTVAKSKSDKYCYTFVQGDKLDSESSGKQKGMYLDPQVLTWWTDQDLRDIAYEQLVLLEVEIVGDSAVVRSIRKKAA